MRIAMWSGPRNLSTAMMYSFLARGDCAVQDEPFYAAFLHSTGLNHPMRDDILASQEIDPRIVGQNCAADIPDGQPHLYLKLMTHHMLADFPMDWTTGFTHVHLLRHPARVIASYVAKRENPTLEDIGFPQQLRLFQQLGGVVIDSYDIRANPGPALEMLCDVIGLPFTAKMLTWSAGPRAEDGVWARHWYHAVHASRGFAAAEGSLPDVPEESAALLKDAMEIYSELQVHKL